MNDVLQARSAKVNILSVVEPAAGVYYYECSQGSRPVQISPDARTLGMRITVQVVIL